MPRVPTFDNLRTQVGGMPGAQFSSPSGPTAGGIAAEQASQLGRSLMAGGGELAKIQVKMQEEANQVRVDDATNQLVQARTQMQLEAMSLTGRSALERPDGQSLQGEYGDRLKKISSDISAKLGNSAQQQSFAQATNQLGNQMNGTLGTHVLQQQKQFQSDTIDATISQASNQAVLLHGDPTMLAQSQAAIESALAKKAAMNGWDATKDKALIGAERAKAMSPMIGGVILAKLKGNQPEAAEAFYKENSANLTIQARANMMDAIQTGLAASKAQSAGAALAEEYDFTQTGDAQKAIDKMDIPPSQKVAIRAELEHRHSIQQSDSDKTNALSIGKIDEMVERGMGLAAIQMTPEYASVRDKGTVLKLLRTRREQAVSLAAATESRDWTRVQRLRSEQTYQAQERVYGYSDPDVLMAMTRPQVAALRLELGNENTSQLLNRWDTFTKSSAKLKEAKMDKEQFDTLADGMGLKPFARGNESSKRALSAAKDRVETAIGAWQVEHRGEMPREEKGKLMSRMIAEQITTEGRMWGTNTTNLLEITPEQVGRVVVPALDRGQIIDKARRETGRADYMPTDAEIARAFLKMKSKAVVNGQ
jgi:hypothetical protein